MKILLHDCCAPCGAFVAKKLFDEGNDVSVYYYNPNIFPKEEYDLRLSEMKRFCEKYKIPFIVGDADHELWRQSVAGYEKEPERGKRCEICFAHRLAEAAQKGSELGVDALATTLTMSPLKSAETINRIGHEVAALYGLEFIDRVWREQNGGKEAVKLAKEENFHRQNYCGCEFSIR